MNIALIQCPGWGRDCPPYTLALFSAILRRAGHGVINVDLNNILYCSGPDEYRKYWDDKDLYSFWSNESLIKKFIQDNKRMIDFQIDRILKSNARIIGFTVHFTSLLMSMELARMIKHRDKDRIIVFGGPDCCRELRGEFIIKDGAVDVVAIGEGELTMLELVRQVQEAGKVEFCKGTLIRQGDGFIDCEDPEIIRNLDLLPFPDYSDFSDDIKSGVYREPQRLDIFDSRSCIIRCHFCSEWQYWKTYRTMSGWRIFSEIQHHVSIFPKVNYFYFIGSLLNGNIKELSRFCDLVIENKLKIRWAGQPIVRPEMTEGLLNKMRQSGCEWLGFGIESGSERVVHSMNKRFSMEDAGKNLRNAHRSGIMVQANFMFGIPGETEADFKETIEFLRRNRENIDSVLASQSFCVLDKGTYLYNHADKFGIKDRDHHLYWESDNGKNTYPERFRRYEEFCQVALSLGLPETSGVLRVKPDKWVLLGDYYNFKKDYNSAVDCYRKSLEIESYNETVVEKIRTCKASMNKADIDFLVLESRFMSYVKNDGYDINSFKGWLGNYCRDVRLNNGIIRFNEKQNCIIESLYRQGLYKKIFNFILAEVQKERRDEEVLAFPYWLTIDPTNFCMLKCPFCPTGQARNSRKKGILSFENFKRIIEELGPYLIHVDFCNWGEPLLNKDIYRMISLAKEYKIDIKIDSNFNHLTERGAEEMVRSGLDKVIVSIDGITPETYSKYRIGGDFEKAMGNMKLLIKKKRELESDKPYISWQFLVFRHNEHEIEGAKRMAREMGVDHIGITKAFIGNKEWFPLSEEYSFYHNGDTKEISSGKTEERFKKPENNFCNWPWEAVVIN
ncbi:MAG: radical SAM protein, partial [Candidatus Omnitrophica bacterium]|nr:radical SAM protein [Candidatus Omnitrophota bacterium]